MVLEFKNYNCYNNYFAFFKNYVKDHKVYGINPNGNWSIRTVKDKNIFKIEIDDVFTQIFRL